MVLFDLQIIFSIEVKTSLFITNAIKAGEQLVKIREMFIDSFDSELKGEWLYVTGVFCITVDPSILNCENKCADFVFTPEDFDAKFDLILKMAIKNRILVKHPEDFVILTRDLTFLAPKFEVTTTRNIHDKIKECLDEAGSVENIKMIAFPTPEQQSVISACDSPDHKLVFLGGWGSGKTMFLKHIAKEFAKKEEKVLFIVTQDGSLMTSNVKTYLILELEEELKEFEDFIKVISLPFIDGRSDNFKTIPQGFVHVIVDEFFQELNLFKPQTKKEVLTFQQWLKRSYQDSLSSNSVSH